MNLDAYRRAQGWSHAELASRVGVTRSYATKLCNGASPSSETAGEISEALGGAVCALHILHPQGIPAGFGGEAACRCGRAPSDSAADAA